MPQPPEVRNTNASTSTARNTNASTSGGKAPNSEAGTGKLKREIWASSARVHLGTDSSCNDDTNGVMQRAI
ncbi:Os07g0248425 [Oryza sativa Japonica Group]|uniref:Os07g0248425 protein n=1 Tax=Oryza sativa subsp. japonica TaxID=39947 RepID=A0A0P0X4F4_ORYSJ|nr:Os07g0248425 [Oryza sativa Japonica Group]